MQRLQIPRQHSTSAAKRGRSVNYLGSDRSGIRRGFCLLALFTLIAISVQANAQSGQLVANPSNLNFGSVAVGASLTQSLVLTNSGGPKITITDANPAA